jgi:hypothetical protein
LATWSSTGTQNNGWYDQNGVFHPFDQQQISDPALSYLIMVHQKVAELEAKLTLLEAKIDGIKRELERLSDKK